MTRDFVPEMPPGWYVREAKFRPNAKKWEVKIANLKGDFVGRHTYTGEGRSLSEAICFAREKIII